MYIIWFSGNVGKKEGKKRNKERGRFAIQRGREVLVIKVVKKKEK